MDKESLLQKIVEYYLKSTEYNGLPICTLADNSDDVLCQLVDEDKVEILSSNDVINPHIKAFNVTTDKDIQKEYIRNKSILSVAYPSKMVLSGIDIDLTMPYSGMLRKGAEQFEILYFDIEILERYANNPKFFIIDNGYRGSIYPEDQYLEDEEIDNEYVKNYGMAYIDGPTFERAVGVFVYDLSKLTAQKQQLWRAFELKFQDRCHIHPGFVKNLVLGAWVTEMWVFHAIIDEMKTINAMCVAMNVPPLYNHTFGTHFSEMPEGYRNILLPTKKNYYDFVLVIEKMLVHNLSFKTFVVDGINVRGINRQDDNGNNKGSIQMLDEWLCANTTAKAEDIQRVIISPLKRIRKIRQLPAHELASNEYNKKYYTDQFNLVDDAYCSLASIRNLLHSNPAVKYVKIPDYLIDGTLIVNY
ncbi:hypothetical protein [Bacteroides acidifaciens]|uniref:hypothetical protein n=1 Tax=Bacteroides acidifaciens TaxID=85831 RepID=UPI0030150D16